MGPGPLAPVALALVLAAAPSCRAADAPGSGISRLVSPRLRAIDERRAAIRAELAARPRPLPGPATEEIGYHSELARSPAAGAWVQVDLGEVFPVDGVALVPALASTAGDEAVGYGFPLRFRIDVAASADFTDFETVADETGADFPNPGVLPYFARGRGVRGRYVRVTATKLYVRQQEPRRWGFALGELIVLSGERNVALGRPVTPPSGLSVPPAWRTENLVDGRSLLGAPLGPEPSAGNGYQGVATEARDVERWVQVDLGRPVALDEVRLVPARPTDWADQPGFGFPVRFRITVAEDDRPGSAVTLADHTGADFPNPRDNPVVVPAGGRRARTVRLTATRLAQRVETESVPHYVLALAELQAYAGGRNVALGAAVTASDSIDDPRYPRWGLRFLVDGAASSHRLIELGAWLEGLAARHRLERELADLELVRTAAAERVAGQVVALGGGALAVVLAGALAGLALQRRARRRQIEHLRRQISSDLHDDVGSSLGSIALLSQVAAGQAAPEDVRRDLADINRIARETAEALRDIVFITAAEPASAGQLADRMREIARVLLAGLELRFEGPAGAAREARVGIELRRHVLLGFKEALHNVARHAQARAVTVRLAVSGGELVLSVADDGRGFDPAEAARGQGLPGLARRAEATGGTFTVESRPGGGTTVTLRAPLEPGRRGGARGP